MAAAVGADVLLEPEPLPKPLPEPTSTHNPLPAPPESDSSLMLRRNGACEMSLSKPLSGPLPDTLSKPLPDTLSKPLPRSLSKPLPEPLSGRLPEPLSKLLPDWISRLIELCGMPVDADSASVKLLCSAAPNDWEVCPATRYCCTTVRTIISPGESGGCGGGVRGGGDGGGDGGGAGGADGGDGEGGGSGGWDDGGHGGGCPGAPDSNTTHERYTSHTRHVEQSPPSASTHDERMSTPYVTEQLAQGMHRRKHSAASADEQSTRASGDGDGDASGDGDGDASGDGSGDGDDCNAEQQLYTPATESPQLLLRRTAPKP